MGSRPRRGLSSPAAHMKCAPMSCVTCVCKAAMSAPDGSAATWACRLAISAAVGAASETVGVLTAAVVEAPTLGRLTAPAKAAVSVFAASGVPSAAGVTLKATTAEPPEMELISTRSAETPVWDATSTQPCTSGA